jgi:heme/copper-type cytochrome/quinol oxidase subunit 4
VNPSEPIVTVWLVLIALTCGSFAVIEGGVLALISPLIVIGIAAYKIRLVMVHFMEVKSATRTWRTMYTTWILVAAAIILIGNYVAVLAST